MSSLNKISEFGISPFLGVLKKFGKQNGLTDEEFEKVAENLADGTGFGEKMEKIFNSFTGKELYNALKT